MARWQRVTPVAVVAGAVLVLVLVGRWLASPAPREPAPVAPKPTTATTRPVPIVATVRLPAAQGEIPALAFDGGSVWVADQAGGALLRVDPKANRVIGRIRMGEPQAGPWGVVAAGGGVWASFEEETIWRIDSRTGKVTDKLPVLNIGAFAVGDGALWSPCCETERPKSSGRVTKVDLATRRVTAKIAIKGNPFTAAVAGTSVWVAGGLPNSMWRIDPAHHTVSTVKQGYARHDTLHMVAGLGALWIANPGGLLKINPDTGRVLATIEFPGRPVGLALAPDAVWVSTDSGALVRVNPVRERVAASLQLTEAGPLTVTPDAVWVASGRSILRIDPARLPTA
jgi:DNA-binding beta-propeller fold protein YncE